MKYLFILFTAFFFTNTYAQDKETIFKISITKLRENPEKYHEKKVTITGFINLEFEGNSLYPKRSDYKKHNYSRSLYIQVTNITELALKKKGINRIYVSMTAIFRKDLKGHFGMWFGSLTEIENVKIIK